MSIIAGAAALRYLKGPQFDFFRWPQALYISNLVPRTISDQLIVDLFLYLEANYFQQQESSSLNNRFEFNVLRYATNIAVPSLCYATGLSHLCLRIFYKIGKIFGYIDKSILRQVQSEEYGHFRNLSIKDVALSSLAAETVFILNQELYASCLGPNKAYTLFSNDLSYDNELRDELGRHESLQVKSLRLMLDIFSTEIGSKLELIFKVGNISSAVLLLQSSAEDLIARPIAYALNRSGILPKFNGHPRFIVTSALARGVSLAIFAYTVDRFAL